MCNHHSRAFALLLLLGLLIAAPGSAWTTDTKIAMADHALRVAPPDLVRQIERHHKRYHAGIEAAGKSDPGGNASGPAPLAEPIIKAEVDRAVQSIIEHQPFSDIVFRLGVVAYWVAAANDPLSPTAVDTTRPPYWQDYSRYLQQASQRFAVLYYGHDRQFDSPEELEALLQRTRLRCQGLAPQVAQEYRRIGSLEGSRLFDDRSTAFGVGSVAFSHGVSDIAGVLRYIWLAAGGADTLHLPPLDSDHLILVDHGEHVD